MLAGALATALAIRWGAHAIAALPDRRPGVADSARRTDQRGRPDRHARHRCRLCHGRGGLGLEGTAGVLWLAAVAVAHVALGARPWPHLPIHSTLRRLLVMIGVVVGHAA